MVRVKKSISFLRYAKWISSPKMLISVRAVQKHVRVYFFFFLREAFVCWSTALHVYLSVVKKKKKILSGGVSF